MDTWFLANNKERQWHRSEISSILSTKKRVCITAIGQRKKHLLYISAHVLTAWLWLFKNHQNTKTQQLPITRIILANHSPYCHSVWNNCPMPFGVKQDKQKSYKNPFCEQFTIWLVWKLLVNLFKLIRSLK